MRHIQNVLQAIAVGLGHDGEVVEVLDNLQQVAGPQPLEPEGRALAGSGTGQQQRSCGVLAEVRAEDGRIRQLVQDALARLSGGHIGDDVKWELGLCVQQAEQDAVVVGLNLDLHAGALAKGAGQGQCPRAVDPPAEGGMDDHSRIAQGILEDLDHDGAVGRDGVCVLKLTGQIVHRVPG